MEQGRAERIPDSLDAPSAKRQTHWRSFGSFSPSVLKTPPGYLLLVITSLTLFGELYWYVKISAAKKFRTTGAFVGALILLLYIITAILAYPLFRF